MTSVQKSAEERRGCAAAAALWLSVDLPVWRLLELPHFRPLEGDFNAHQDNFDVLILVPGYVGFGKVTLAGRVLRRE